jgi:Heavy metal associated domain 2
MNDANLAAREHNMSRIVSSIPGRIRIRDNKLRDQTILDRLKTELLNISVITTLESNRRTGSLLVRFSKNSVAMPSIEAQIDSAVDRVIGNPAASQRLLSKKNLNRYNKIAMLLLLGTSLFTLNLAGRKRRIRWHRLTGYLFLANLGVHLFTYRKSLSRLFR